jgi:hypothetical protein
MRTVVSTLQDYLDGLYYSDRDCVSRAFAIDTWGRISSYKCQAYSGFVKKRALLLAR